MMSSLTDFEVLELSEQDSRVMLCDGAAKACCCCCCCCSSSGGSSCDSVEEVQ
jgi:hypothetical protein